MCQLDHDWHRRHWLCPACSWVATPATVETPGVSLAAEPRFSNWPASEHCWSQRPGSDPVGLAVGLGICIANQIPGDATAGPGTSVPREGDPAQYLQRARFFWGAVAPCQSWTVESFRSPLSPHCPFLLNRLPDVGARADNLFLLIYNSILSEVCKAFLFLSY